MACARLTPMWSTPTFSPPSRAEPARSSAGNGCAREPRPALREHDPHARHGRRSAGEFRASRNADGDGAGGLHAVAVSAEIRSGRPGLAELGALRALDAPRLDAAVL